MRTWGLYFIPRDKAPDEGFLLTYTRKGGTTPGVQEHRGARWKAWWLPHDPESDQPHYKHDGDVVRLIDKLSGYWKNR